MQDFEFLPSVPGSQPGSLGGVRLMKGGGGKEDPGVRLVMQHSFNWEQVPVQTSPF